MRLVTIARIN